MRDVSVDLGAGGWKMLPLSALLFALPAVAYWLVWDENFARQILQASSLLVLIPFIVVHEAIHGITFALAGRVPLSKIRYGVMWKSLAPYAHLSVPVDVRAYRIGVAMPGIVLGIILYAVGLALGNMYIAGWGTVGIVTATGDLWILVLLRGVARASRVLDHPDKVGCMVFDPEEVFPAAAAS
jgi:hypothetical protein